MHTNTDSQLECAVLARRPMAIRERGRERQVGALGDRERRELEVSADDIDVPAFLRDR